MLDDLYLPVIAIVVLSCCLVCALGQLRTDHPHGPTLLWREALDDGWSDWIALEGVSSVADYTAVLAAVREAAHPGAIAVQFAFVVRPCDAPEYTLRVLFLSDVREPGHDHTLPTHH
jgi:hypothetical protein